MVNRFNEFPLVGISSLQNFFGTTHALNVTSESITEAIVDILPELYPPTRARNMLTPRFQLPDPDESPDSLKNQTLILRCMQDPLHVAIKNPSDGELEALLRQVPASLPTGALHMIIESLRENTPLDRGALSFIAEVSKATVEEATSLVWNDGKPELTRYVVISGLGEEPESDGPNSSQGFAPDNFQLTIDRTGTGDIEVALGWENGDCAESLEALNDRWTRMNEVYKSLGREALPWDLLPHAIERSAQSHDDEYVFEGLTMAAYPMDLDVILQDLETEERLRQEDVQEASGHHHDDARDDDDEWGLFQGVNTGEAPDDDEHAADFEDDSRSQSDEGQDGSDALIMPGEDLTIIDPTSHQLTSIAKLSSMPVSRQLIEQLMQATREGAPLQPDKFKFVSAKIREQICLHQRGTFILNGSMTETQRYSLDEVDLNKPTMFCINLTYQTPSTPQPDGVLKSVLHWEHFLPDYDVPNWDKIVDIAKRQG